MDANLPPEPPRRLTATVFVSVAFGMVALYAAFTAAPLVAEDLTGARTWSGLPGAAAIAGTSLGTAVLSALMARRGRRPGLVAGWATGAAGAVLALAGIAAGSFVLFVSAMLVLGVGHGANQLARFAAADLHPVRRRGTVLSLVVWVGTIGAVVGPNLLEPTGSIANRLGMVPLAGGYLAAAVAFGLPALIVGVALRPDPAVLAIGGVGGRTSATSGWNREVSVAVAALVAAQFVMLLIMTMTPVHIRGHEHGLAAVGGVMSVHFAGMFVLAPIAGKASDRFGGLRVACTGLVMVAVAGVLAAVAPTTSVAVVSVALLLLGLGWSAAFVASSSLLASAGALVQGRADAVGWAFAATASIGSGILVATVGYATMCLVGAAIATAAALRVGTELRRASPDERNVAPAVP
jgi:MFS family permease